MSKGGKQSKNWIWWKHGVVYQIYPRSFYDSNGDGIGDIPGIIQKLDYLTSLGIDAVWLSPVYESPMYDFGYDIRNYRNIDPIFGTLHDFKVLLKEAHHRNIRIIMDMVMNHTSHQHPWFLESKASRSNAKRNWYIWSNGKGPLPPNNWLSAFGGSAWEWDSSTEQYYMHSFLKEQPDLNWRNEEMADTFFQEITFWLNLGVDGFRLDVINWIGKDKKFRDNPFWLKLLGIQKHQYDRNRAISHKVVKRLRKQLDAHKDKLLVGEVFVFPPGNPALAASYLGKNNDELHLAFDFSLIYRWWSAKLFYKCLKRWYDHIPENGWPALVLSNHDMPRAISRYGKGREKTKKARVAAFLILTAKGTPFLYYGEEIGMPNLKLPKSQISDPLGKRYWPIYPGRDPSRAPMQWSSERYAGFSTTTPWIKVDPCYKKVNVEDQQKDHHSLLNTYQKLIQLRKKSWALQAGDHQFVKTGRNGILAYLRIYGSEKMLVVLNFSGQEREAEIPEKSGIEWAVVAATHLPVGTYFEKLQFKLNPYEAIVLKKLPS
ncbi:MAG TPA: alpha-glucosidase [Williamwhitmania sp.]|nr:alpha-glucosidase [Williamwhitmania sp.]